MKILKKKAFKITPNPTSLILILGSIKNDLILFVSLHIWFSYSSDLLKYIPWMIHSSIQEILNRVSTSFSPGPTKPVKPSCNFMLQNVIAAIKSNSCNFLQRKSPLPWLRDVDMAGAFVVFINIFPPTSKRKNILVGYSKNI